MTCVLGKNKTRIPRLLDTWQQAVLGLLVMYDVLPNNRNKTNVGFPYGKESLFLSVSNSLTHTQMGTHTLESIGRMWSSFKL